MTPWPTVDECVDLCYTSYPIRDAFYFGMVGGFALAMLLYAVVSSFFKVYGRDKDE